MPGTTYRVIRPLANRMLGFWVYSTFGWFLGMAIYFGISTVAYFAFMPQEFAAEPARTIDEPGVLKIQIPEKPAEPARTPQTFLAWIFVSGLLGGWILFTTPLTILGGIIGLIIGIEQTSLRMVPWRRPIPEHLRRPRPAPSAEA